MNAEGSRHNEHDYSWHVWKVPKGMPKQHAIEYFLSQVKPSGYIFETIRYDPGRGEIRTC